MEHEVVLHVYDLSMGMARSMSGALLGMQVSALGGECSGCIAFRTNSLGLHAARYRGRVH